MVEGSKQQGPDLGKGNFLVDSGWSMQDPNFVNAVTRVHISADKVLGKIGAWPLFAKKQRGTDLDETTKSNYFFITWTVLSSLPDLIWR